MLYGRSYLSIYIVGLFYTSTLDRRYPLTLVDYESEWSDVYFVPVVMSGTVKSCLRSVFSGEDYTKELVSDSGPQFVSVEFQQFLEEVHVFLYITPTVK